MSERPTMASLNTDMQVTKAENIARDKAIADLAEAVKSIDGKLTELLELKHKGAGALWLIGLLGMSAIVAALTAVWHWFRG